MKAKKITALLLIFTLVLLLASCSLNKDEFVTVLTEPDYYSSINEASVTDGSELKLRIVTNATYKPFEYYYHDELLGFDIALANALASRLGAEAEITDSSFDTLNEKLSSGKADIAIAALTKNDIKTASKTNSYYSTVLSLVVRSRDELESVDDLVITRGIAVLADSAGQFVAEEKFSGCSVWKFSNGSDVIAAVVNGTADAAIIDSDIAKEYTGLNYGAVILKEKYYSASYIIAVAPGKEELTASLNEIIAEMKKDGTIDELKKSYIPGYQ